jgi:hypothetical protein
VISEEPEATMAEEPNPNQKLETVFDTADETEAAVVQGLLESAGIESLVTSPDAPQEVMPGLGGVGIKVPADRVEEARRVIGEYYQRIVTILQTDDLAQVERIQSRLESAEIEVTVRSLPRGYKSGTVHEVRILEADLEKAQPILEELGVKEDITAEDESEEPPRAASA